MLVPDYLKSVHGNEGLENATRDDLILPRLSICQSLTPQRKPQNPLYIKGLEEGQLFNTVTGEVYGGSVELIPLVFTKSRIYFRDMKEGGGILCQSFNGIDGGSISPTCDACPNSKFSGDQAPACSDFKNFVSFVLPTRHLLVVSFKSTAIKAAKAWLTRMQMFNKPSYAGIYEISTQPGETKKGDFFAPVIKFKRFVSQEEYAFATREYAALKGKNIKTDEAIEHEREAGDDTEDIPF